MLLLSGASGAGKTSVRESIGGRLAPAVEAVELRHLGTVPDNPDVAWRQRMAERAVLHAKTLDGHGRHLLLAGDPVAPGEVLAAPWAPTADIAVCLLDVNEAAQRKRLSNRGDPEELLPTMSRSRPGCAATRRTPAICRTSSPRRAAVPR